jgi:hypothetical protein
MSIAEFFGHDFSKHECFKLYDKNGNILYWEHDKNGNMVYYKNSKHGILMNGKKYKLVEE